MFCNNEYVEELSRDGKLRMPITTLFIGSYSRAIDILLDITQIDDDDAVATKCWRVQFDDAQTKKNFLCLCPDALCVDGFWWLVENCVIREWLIDQGGILLEEIVAIEFSSLRLRAAFMAETDH
jgi:hypothetical protein